MYGGVSKYPSPLKRVLAPFRPCLGLFHGVSPSFHRSLFRVSRGGRAPETTLANSGGSPPQIRTKRRAVRGWHSVFIGSGFSTGPGIAFCERCFRGADTGSPAGNSAHKLRRPSSKRPNERRVACGRLSGSFPARSPAGPGTAVIGRCFGRAGALRERIREKGKRVVIPFQFPRREKRAGRRSLW
jgi:hypothetical protein